MRSRIDEVSVWMLVRLLDAIRRECLECKFVFVGQAATIHFHVFPTTGQPVGEDAVAFSYDRWHAGPRERRQFVNLSFNNEY
jgi:hypothetical protein